MEAARIEARTGRPWLSIVGIGEDGVEGLSAAARAAVADAGVVFGGLRHLTLASALIGGESVAWGSPLEATLPLVLGRSGQPTCILATGDPFHYGIGATLVRHIASAELMCFPQPSAFSLAAARLGWPLQDTCCLSLHGRMLTRIIPDLHPRVRLLALSWDGSTPVKLAKLLTARGFGPSRLHVCEALGGPDERIRIESAAAFSLQDVADLNTIGIEVESELGARARPLTSGLPDAWFEHDGQITKAPIRAVTLSGLAPQPGDTLWDIGAGSGSVSVEWLFCDPSLRAVAVERQAARAARIAANADHWGVSERLSIVEGSAPAALAGLPRPEAVFIGGGAGTPGLLESCRDSLRDGGRFVVNAVTIETQALVIQSYRQHGGDLLTLSTGQAEPVGAFHGIRPNMPVMQWRWTKP